MPLHRARGDGGGQTPLFYAMANTANARSSVHSVFTMANEFVGVGVMRMESGNTEPSPDNVMASLVPRRRSRP